MATTTNYSWTTPDNTAYVKDGASAIRTLGSSVDSTLFTALGGAYPGLRLVKKQTIGTGVASVAVTSAFSATYQNYIIKVSGGANSALGHFKMVFDSITTGYYAAFPYTTYAGASAFTPTNNGANFQYMGIAATNGLTAQIDVANPFLTCRTMVTSDFYDNSGAGRTSGFLDSVASVTGFTLQPSTGTMTGGTIYVYGYGIS